MVVVLTMDKLDKDLIRILQRDAKTPYIRIGKELGRRDTTIRFRVQRLEANNIVPRFSARVRPEALGYNQSALMTIEIGGHIVPDISKDRTHTFAEELSMRDEYLWVAVDEAPMLIRALVMGGDESDIQEEVDRLRKSPDVVNVTANPLSKVLKGWEISGTPEK
jgi:DNA-binding Lrp family transcriptional regulator